MTTDNTLILRRSKGFTLIELLVVIAIIGVLASVVLLAINPAELLRKSRDATRFSNLNTVRKAIDAGMADGTLTSFPICSTAKTATTCGNSVDQGRAIDGSGWVGNATAGTIDLSRFISTLPIDPLNGNTTTKLPTATNSTGGVAVTWQYYYRSDGSGYKLAAYVESKDNVAKATGDGGPNSTCAATGTTCMYETGTNLSATMGF